MVKTRDTKNLEFGVQKLVGCFFKLIKHDFDGTATFFTGFPKLPNILLAEPKACSQEYPPPCYMHVLESLDELFGKCRLMNETLDLLKMFTCSSISVPYDMTGETSLRCELHLMLSIRFGCIYIMLFVKSTHLEQCFDHISSQSVYN